MKQKTLTAGQIGLMAALFEAMEQDVRIALEELPKAETMIGTISFDMKTLFHVRAVLERLQRSTNALADFGQEIEKP